jgi:hypothetical protein
MLVRAALAILLMTGLVASSAQGQPPTQYNTTQFSQRQVNLERLARTLARLGIELPVTLSGTATVEGSVGYPRGGFLAPRRYRVEAVIASPRLVIEGVELDNVRAALLYQDGVARLRELSFRVPQGDQPPGQIAGSADLPLSPAGDLTTQLTVTRLPVERLLAAFPGLENLAQGRLSGEIRGSVDPGQMTDPAAWRLTGNVNLENVTSQGLPPLHALAQLQAENGVLSLSRLDGVMRSAKFGGFGRMALTAPYRYNLDVLLNDPQIGWVNDLPADLRPPVTLQGTLRLSGRVRGQLEPFLWRLESEAVATQLRVGESNLAALSGDVTARGEWDSAAAPDLFPEPRPDEHPWRVGGVLRAAEARIAGVLVDALEATVNIDEQQLEMTGLQAALYGGMARGSSSFPWSEQGEAQLALQLQRVELGELLDDLDAIDFPLRGEAEGAVDVTIPVDAPQEIARWGGVGRLTVSDVQIFRWTAGTLQTDFQLNRGALVLSELVALQADMRLRASGQIGLAAPYDYTIWSEATRFDLAKLNALPESLRPPAVLDGVANVQLEGLGQLQPFSYHGEGAVNASSLRWDDVKVDSLRGKFSANERRAAVSDVAATLYGGSLYGDAEFSREVGGDTHAALRLQGVQLQPLLDAWDVLEFPLRGEAEGVVDLLVPADAPNAIERWRGAARLALHDAEVFGWTAAQAHAEFLLDQGRLLISTAQVMQQELRLELTGSVGLQKPYTYSLWADGAEFDLATLSTLPEAMRPPVALEGLVSLQLEGVGQLQPRTFVGRGVGHAAAVRVNQLAVESARIEFRADPQHVEVLQLDAALYEGVVQGSGVWPLAEDAPMRLDAHWQTVDVARLLDELHDLPVRLEGLSSGAIFLAAPPGALADVRQWQVRAAATGDDIRINGARAASFQARAEREQDRLNYRLDATVLDGRLQLDGRLPMDRNAPVSSEGALVLTNLQLAPLGDMFRSQEALQSLTGAFDLTASFTHDAENFAPTGRGSFQLRAVEISRTTVADRIDGGVLFTPTLVRVENVAGGLAGGRLQGSATYRLGANQPGVFDVTLRGAEAARFLGMWLEDAPLEGRLDLSLRGRLGDVVQAAGRALVTRAEAAGFGLGTMRSPVTLELSPAQGRGRLTLRGVSAAVGTGRMSGDLVLAWGYGLDVDAKIRFDGVDLPRLLEDVDAGTDWVSGKITGDLALSGRNVQSARDLNGSLEARLRSVQALKFPVLEALRPYTGGASYNTQFNEGDLRVTLSRGVARVHRLSLISDGVQAYLDGTVTVEGRLNLEAIVHTGDLRAIGRRAESLVQAFAVSLAPEAALLARATEFLSNRVVYLRIGGTVARPVPRVQPLPILRDEAIRFFFDQVRS